MLVSHIFALFLPLVLKLKMAKVFFQLTLETCGVETSTSYKNRWPFPPKHFFLRKTCTKIFVRLIGTAHFCSTSLMFPFHSPWITMKNVAHERARVTLSEHVRT
jgi:hypothetical protein